MTEFLVMPSVVRLLSPMGLARFAACFRMDKLYLPHAGWVQVRPFMDAFGSPYTVVGFIDNLTGLISWVGRRASP